MKNHISVQHLNSLIIKDSKLLSPQNTIPQHYVAKKIRVSRNELNYLTINFIFTYMPSLFILVLVAFILSLRTSHGVVGNRNVCSHPSKRDSVGRRV